MEFKGTKGDWFILGNNYPTIECKSTNETIVHTVPTIAVVNASFRDSVEIQANALLISKAPKILNQLYDLAILSIQSDRYREDSEYKIVVDKAFELLRQATNI